ncbi:MAG: AAA family ATPase, partial [Acidimicrobiia bacterium]|nr:AAA family ATPase [Acidimicrobiia bacterium]
MNLVLAHLMVAGGVLGGGERSAHTVFDYSVPAQVFPVAAQYVALGHLHRAQELPAACPVRYCGSPLQLDFGETGDTKSVTIVIAEAGRPADWWDVETLEPGVVGTIEGSLEELRGPRGHHWRRLAPRAGPRAGLGGTGRSGPRVVPSRRRRAGGHSRRGWGRGRATPPERAVARRALRRVPRRARRRRRPRARPVRRAARRGVGPHGERLMRPLRLSLEGFSSFRERVEVDFGEADLFALAGPTGSGKSVIDGITFALYGRVARYDLKMVAPVINQRSQSALVDLTFAVGSVEYRVVREVQRTKKGASTKEARLERGDDVLAGDAKGVTATVAGLLGLDFTQFTRCVVLPQGAFAEFLHDEPAERRRLLIQLLDLGVYARMAAAANERSRDASARSDLIDQQLGELAERRRPSRTRLLAVVATSWRRSWSGSTCVPVLEELHRCRRGGRPPDGDPRACGRAARRRG